MTQMYGTLVQHCHKKPRPKLLISSRVILLPTSLHNGAHHYNLYGDGHRQLGFVSVIQLLNNEDHHHDEYGHNQVTDVGGGDLVKDYLQGLMRRRSQIKDTHSWTVVNC